MLRIICGLLFSLSLAMAADVTGSWQFSVQTNQGSGSPAVELQQQGEKLTGTFHSQILGDAKLTGTVKGNVIEFSFEGDAQGQKLVVTYKGTIDNPTAMKGTASYAGVDNAVTWSAAKK